MESEFLVLLAWELHVRYHPSDKTRLLIDMDIISIILDLDLAWKYPFSLFSVSQNNCLDDILEFQSQFLEF